MPRSRGDVCFASLTTPTTDCSGPRGFMPNPPADRARLAEEKRRQRAVDHDDVGLAGASRSSNAAAVDERHPDRFEEARAHGGEGPSRARQHDAPVGRQQLAPVDPVVGVVEQRHARNADGLYARHGRQPLA